MNPNCLLWIVTCLVVLLITGCVPTPTPNDFGRNMQYPLLQGTRSCGLVVPPGVKVRARELRILPGAGGDTLFARGGSGRLSLFDSASPTTIEDHDVIVLAAANPSDYQFYRVGADLLICGAAYFQEFLLLRHYCFDATAEPAWNNQFEEITFPDSRETWLADDIYDALTSDSEFPSEKRIRELYKIEEESAKLAAAEWRVRPFHEVLPPAWFAAIACNNDLAAPDEYWAWGTSAIRR